MIALPVASALQLEKGFRTTLLCSVGFSFASHDYRPIRILLSQRSSRWFCITYIGIHPIGSTHHQEY